MDCAVCGKELAYENEWWIGDRWVFCPQHGRQIEKRIEDFIKGLKPKVKVESRHGGYWLSEGMMPNHGGMGDGLINERAANALYEHMKAERSGNSPSSSLPPAHEGHE